MNRVHRSILAASLLASASMVAAQSRSVQIASLGFQADIVSTNNRGDVVTRDVLWARGELVRIGPLPGGGFVAAFGVNERRQVVGWADSDSGLRAFLWENGFTMDLGTLGGSETTAFDINSRGQVVGMSRVADEELHGFVWHRGIMHDLGPAVFVTAINNRGQVVGTRPSPSGDLRAFIWTNGRFVYLPRQPGWEVAVPNDINDRGQVVGQVGVGLETRPFFWDGARAVIELPILPGSTSALAYAINNRSQIVGWGGAGEFSHGILWDNGVPVDLGTLPDGRYSYATDINERGDIVGASEDAERQSMAVRWRVR